MDNITNGSQQNMDTYIDGVVVTNQAADNAFERYYQMSMFSKLKSIISGEYRKFRELNKIVEDDADLGYDAVRAGAVLDSEIYMQVCQNFANEYDSLFQGKSRGQ